ncbi:helix-turn-helix domain-containing protein [Verrucosispora sp. WMMA2044]|uniref:MarR family transcriptional regulator n=1 Tax=Verrucosispora sp. WMMA2044 TaxID=3016419 RepID=UPI00248AF0BC|nr:helix-turn-helix domain-containing protein [Verrucosispora sp. WMMA2044]WBB47445.1 helix-turn-helix domain-containing protein [Verrucosispora sp. WMMA2044]
MLISASVWQALTEAGVALVPRAADRVELSYADARATLTVIASPTPLTPRDITMSIDRHAGPCLIIVPSATVAVREAIDAAGWSWLIDGEQQVTGVLRLDGERVALRPPTEAVKRSAKRGRVPWGTFTLVRRLIQRPYATQQELAVLVGVSQPRISQALAALTDKDLVRRTPSGWVVRDLDEAIRWWLSTYPGPGGISTYWYNLAPVVEQARAIVEMAAQTDAAGVVVSGDVAADIIAPWRAPTRAIIYARDGVNLADAGFVPAGGEEATLELTVPSDPGLCPPSGQAAPGLPLADPLQILWDVRRSPGPDNEEAAQRVWNTLRQRHHDRRHAA